jgi:hypothetical protein
MLPSLKLSLDGFQLRDHPLLRRDPPDDERSITDTLPTEVSKTHGRSLSSSAAMPNGGWRPSAFGIEEAGTVQCLAPPSEHRTAPRELLRRLDAGTEAEEA